MKFVVKAAHFVNGDRKDIVVDGDTIVAVVGCYEGEGEVIHVPKDTYVSPGWIDLHTHAFPKFAPYCSQPDIIGYETGVTTVVDAGSSGSDDMEEFYQEAMKSKTRVFAFMNVAKIGLSRIDELADLVNLQYDSFQDVYRKYPDFIVGIKARMSASVVKNNGIEPLKIAKSFSEMLQLPMMVHIGSNPPDIEDVLNELRAEDIVTHCFNGKKNNIFKEQEQPGVALLDAINRGVLLDIGHGTESFSFQIAAKARKNHLSFHTISTDIYDKNRLHGPVYNMATTLTKLLYVGHSLEVIIEAVTETPANIIKKKRLGKIQEGYLADLTFFQIKQEKTLLTDSYGETVSYHQKIVPTAVMLGGEYIELS